MNSKFEPISRAEEDDVSRALVSIIAKTRRHWSMLPDRCLEPEAAIGVGIGYAALTRDGEPVYVEDALSDREPMTVAEAERLAQREPDHDWRIHLVAQLEDRHYRRQGAGLWVIYERGYGMS